MNDNYYATFNSFFLKSDSYTLIKLDVGSPRTKVSKYELARADGQVVTSQHYGEREITVEGKINADNLDDMNTKLDSLKAALVGIDKNLDVYYGNSLRRYTATVGSFEYKTQGYFCEYTIIFTANAFGIELENTSLVFGTYLSSGTTYSNTISGSYKSKPVIQFVVNQIDPYWQTGYIDITNNELTQRIRINKTFNWYETLVIDAEQKTVSVYETTKTIVDLCEAITGWTSTHTLALETANMKQGAGALKVSMASASATTDFIRLNTTATNDFSSTSGKIILPIFIPTPDAGAVASISFYMGSDATLASNYMYWTVSTQWDGSALATNAWNYVVIDLSTSATGTTGSPVRTAIKSTKIVINGTAGTMKLTGALLDYITLQKAGVTATEIDYEGIFPDLSLGNCALLFSDNLTSRNITVTGYYKKRYL